MTDSASDKAFVDTNVLLYALMPGQHRSAAAERILSEQPLLSVQVLNEFVDVLKRKTRWSWDQIEQALKLVHQLCGPPVPLTQKTHQAALEIARRYEFRIYDALIVAAALEVGCTTLYSEDMQDGQKIHALTVRNPFAVP
jgi:predicted nucleic acid-binding protein